MTWLTWYKPISLCQTYTLFEGLLLTCLSLAIEPSLMKEQAGFRPGKSCPGQLLNLTQTDIGWLPGRCYHRCCFEDLSATCDTVNHCRLMQRTCLDIQLASHQLGKYGRKLTLCRVVRKEHRWHRQTNSLPQGRVPAPSLFNIYINDQPIHPYTRSFIYGDDLCITTQNADFLKAEATLCEALVNLSSHYKENHPGANPSNPSLRLPLEEQVCKSMVEDQIKWS